MYAAAVINDYLRTSLLQTFKLVRIHIYNVIKLWLQYVDDLQMS